jgi:hypothetical protein
MHVGIACKSVIPYGVFDVREFLQTHAAKCMARDAFWRDAKNPYFTGFFRMPAIRGAWVEGGVIFASNLMPAPQRKGHRGTSQNFRARLTIVARQKAL